MRSQSEIRGQFLGLSSDLIRLENAGGSEVPSCVVQRIEEFLLSSYVQLGAPDSRSQEAGER